ncbi:helix-turn-helix domain-containing protein [Treponema sp.]|uniref:helix-turn-helix domain-containing protein n=1 Tax=Treponema sp. TaxID=166 RepID=UPI003F11080F
MKDEKLHIHTMQSYLVFKTEKFYQRVICDKGISHFYSFSIPDKQDEKITLMPDGCSNILFEYSPNNMKSYFIGNIDACTDFQLRKNADYFGIRFEPGENPFLFRQEAKDLVSQKIPLGDFGIMENLEEKMSGQKTFTTRMCTFMEEYLNFLKQTKKGHCQLFVQMVRLVVRKNGIIKISELEKLSGYSNRYINLLFETNLGCSAKQFCSMVKMHSVLHFLNYGGKESFANFSNRYDFYDQSHFVHSFKIFTGMTPSQYIDAIKKSCYQSRVLNWGQDFQA